MLGGVQLGEEMVVVTSWRCAVSCDGKVITIWTSGLKIYYYLY